MYPLRGRDRELQVLLDAWRSAQDGQLRYVRLAGEPGVGKTRLVQELYLELARNFDPPSAGFEQGYWPDIPPLGRAQDTLVPPLPEPGAKLPRLPYFWWALSCRQGNESQNESFQPYADGLEQLSAHLLGQLQGVLVKQAWAEVLHGLLHASFEYVPLIGPLMKGVYNPVRNLNARLRKLREPLQVDDKLLSRSGGAAAAGSLEEVYIQLLAALNNPADKRFPDIPACIVIDDAQWADARSIAFTQRLLELGLERGWRLLVVATVRGNELAAQLEHASSSGHDRATTAGELELGLLRRAGAERVLRLDLAPELGEDALRQLLADHLPNAAPELLDVLQARVGGHPYFAVNYAHLVEEEGWIGPDGRLTVDADTLCAIPAEVSAVIDRRLDLLEPGRRRVLNWGSVQGLKFVDTLVRCAAEKLDQRPGESLVALDSLQRAHNLVGLLPPPPADERLYQFTHRLLFERVRQGFSPELQEYQLVRSALGEMLREHLEQHVFDNWPADELSSALSYLADYAAERAATGRAAERSGWAGAGLLASGRLLGLLHERGDNIAAEPLALRVWQQLAAMPPDTLSADGLSAAQRLGLLPALCAVLRLRAHWDEWLHCAEYWLKLSRSAGDAAAEAEAQLSLAELNSSRGSYDEALRLYDAVAQLARKMGDRAGEAEVLAGMAETYCDLTQYERALELYEQCREIRAQLGDEPGVLEAREGVANVFRLRVDAEPGLPLYEEVLAGYQRLRDEAGMARVLKSMAALHSYHERTARAEELLERCLEIERRIGDEHGAGETLRILAIAILDKDEFERARELAEQSLEIAKRIGDIHGQARSLHTVASAWFSSGRADLALPMLEQSLNLFEIVGDKHQSCKTLNNIAMILFNQGQIERALKQFLRVVELFKSFGDEFHAGWSLASVGWVQLCLGRYAESIAASEEALSLRDYYNPYFNISHAKWLRGDADALEHYRAGIQRYGRPPDLPDFDELVRRQLAVPDKVAQLVAELGLTPAQASPAQPTA